MINTDFYTLKEFLLENLEFIKGAKLQKIQQPSRRDFILSLRNSGEGRKLYINISDAKSINTALYQTMQAQSYRNNYNRQVNYRPMPYWQSRSNYSTGNRNFQNQSNYSRYMNSVQYSPYRAPYGSCR